MSNIVLIGMSGAGKSTLGVLLAKALNKNFLDTDLLIQRKYNAYLDQIISEHGIDQFKCYEETVLSQLSVSDTIVATGGSAVYSHKSMVHLSKKGTVVFLDVDFEHLKIRIGDIKSRGIVIEPGQTLKDLYEQRQPLYKQYADEIITIGEESIEETIDIIIGRLKIKNEE